MLAATASANTRRYFSTEKTVGRDVVRAFHEDGPAIDFQVETLTVFVGSVDELYRPQTNSLPPAIEDTAVSGDRYLEVVQIRFTQAVGPPATRFRYRDVNVMRIRTGRHLHRHRLTDPGDVRTVDRKHAGQGTAHVDVDGNTQLRFLIGELTDDAVQTGDTRALDELKVYGPPDARRHEPRPPVPAIVIRRLARIDAQALVRVVVLGRIGEAALLMPGKRFADR